MPGSVLAPPAQHPAPPEHSAHGGLPAVLAVVVVAGMALSASRVRGTVRWHLGCGTARTRSSVADRPRYTGDQEAWETGRS